ncbi:hypothetical protein [Riemerella columbipharyngis]|uniref:DUF721 domain-containing protein n=1 Tax=Riemerella columbipharyngis TaxID=1071918 RepID=A0A1G7BM69_9FLAO|nr:hypothetical protein [Riemerella columbipharyngis]SDE28012.1 hypothetical protein SAMN05421544_10642 [Riemerella columbipharyngis]
MKKIKKREFQSSELLQSLAKIYHFEDKLKAFEIKDFLKEYLDDTLFNEINDIHLKNKILTITIKSPLANNDFRMKKTFFLRKIQSVVGEDVVKEIVFLSR